MDLDPMGAVEDAKGARDEQDAAARSASDRRKSFLNNLVAITVALLATFLGICHIKDDNIVQAMQQAQADRIDNWSYYQARNIREEIANSTVVQLKLQAAAAPARLQKDYSNQIAAYTKIASEQHEKKEEQKKAAEDAEKMYDAKNIHDDQFDLADAQIAIAISLLALTSLTQKRWLYTLALVPTVFGVLMGLAGLLGWGLHPTWLTNLLS